MNSCKNSEQANLAVVTRQTYKPTCQHKNKRSHGNIGVTTRPLCPLKGNEMESFAIQCYLITDLCNAMENDIRWLESNTHSYAELTAHYICILSSISPDADKAIMIISMSIDAVRREHPGIRIMIK